MYARHVTLRIAPGSVDRAVEIFAHEVLPLLGLQTGFRDALMLTGAGGDGVIAIFWSCAEDSQRLEDAGFYREQIAKFAPVFAAPPEPRLLEVRCWVGAQPAAGTSK
jgi:hypothetical protein